MKKYQAEFAKLTALIFEDGVQEGLQQARDALAAPPNKKISGAALAVGPKKKRNKVKKSAPKPLSGGMTVEHSVLECIEVNPGLTGAEIIKQLSNLNPRTIRTMLRRLRLNGQIYKNGEVWFKK
jgi:hypothetical protein